MRRERPRRRPSFQQRDPVGPRPRRRHPRGRPGLRSRRPPPPARGREHEDRLVIAATQVLSFGELFSKLDHMSQGPVGEQFSRLLADLLRAVVALPRPVAERVVPRRFSFSGARSRRSSRQRISRRCACRTRSVVKKQERGLPDRRLQPARRRTLRPMRSCRLKPAVPSNRAPTLSWLEH